MSAGAPSTGIYIRQQMPNGASYTNSPDLFVAGTSAPFDTEPYTDPKAYHWYFSQAPVFGAANYLFVRGVNYTPTGSQTSRVYFYFAQSDQVLDPTKWQSTGFTVGGVTQNYATLSALSLYQFVLPSAQVMWTPPTPTTQGATYYLISWIDNSASPVPPTFPNIPFANLAALEQYVQQNPSMALLDTVYRGAFIRQFPAQTVNQGGTGALTSPDLISTGMLATANFAAFASSGSYNPGVPAANVTLGMYNFIYVRAINTALGAAKARVYLYWTAASSPNPTGWRTSQFTVAGVAQNWVDLTASASQQIMVSAMPVVWTAPNDTAPSDCILIAYVDNSTSPAPPDFTAFGYAGMAGVTAFLASHPQMSGLQLVGAATPGYTLSWNQSLSPGNDDGGTVYVGVQLQNIPIDGTISFSVPGPDQADTLVIQNMRVPDPNAYVVWKVTYPANYVTNMALTYVQGATPPPGGANILPFVMLG